MYPTSSRICTDPQSLHVSDLQSLMYAATLLSSSHYHIKGVDKRPLRRQPSQQYFATCCVYPVTGLRVQFAFTSPIPAQMNVEGSIYPLTEEYTFSHEERSVSFSPVASLVESSSIEAPSWWIILSYVV